MADLSWHRAALGPSTHSAEWLQSPESKAIGDRHDTRTLGDDGRVANLQGGPDRSDPGQRHLLGAVPHGLSVRADDGDVLGRQLGLPDGLVRHAGEHLPHGHVKPAHGFPRAGVEQR